MSAHMWTLDRVVTEGVGGSMKNAYRLLERGTFPIAGVKYGGVWRFTDHDVRAFIERREVTNPLLLQPRRLSRARAALLATAVMAKAS